MSNEYVSHNGQACGIMMNTNHEIFHPIGLDDNKFRFMPGPELNLQYYRGQNRFYELCYSSQYRLKDTDRQAEKDKKTEFINLLKTHPTIKELETIKIQNSSYSTDYEGLAQHYGFATDYIDITNDKNVAMFFACTIYEDGNYKIIEEDREVVLYAFEILHPNDQDRLNIVGAHAIPRPAEQKAFSIKLNEKENFNDLLFVKYKKIICTKKMSTHYFDLFDGGTKLFPDDIVEKKAKQIQNKTLNTERECASYFTKREISSIRKEWFKNRKQFYEKTTLPRMSCYV